uniref:Uncharacterized protein n=1 Tax=Anopheles dirus TaxID=7168 RepID=A0A182NLS2_9DIPT
MWKNVSAGLTQPRALGHQPRIVKREATVPAEPKEAAEALEGQDDMDKAETFGFGYHKVIHTYPSFYSGYGYPSYYGYGYPSYYQPSFYHGMPHAPQWPAPIGPVPVGRLMKREVHEPSKEQVSTSLGNAEDVEGAAVANGNDDMDKAETFGFGYHRYYAYPRYYYPSYYYERF